VAMGRIGKRMPQLFSADIGLIQSLFEALAKVYCCMCCTQKAVSVLFC